MFSPDGFREGLLRWLADSLRRYLDGDGVRNTSLTLSQELRGFVLGSKHVVPHVLPDMTIDISQASNSTTGTRLA